MNTKPYHLSNSTRIEVKNQTYDLCVLPWSSVEPHNYHLPYATEVIQSELIALKSAALAWDKGQKAILYNFTSSPWKTQRTFVLICDSLYKNRSDGLCGNEDCGRMSAWYIFCTMGFYSVNLSTGVYQIGILGFPKAEIKLATNKFFKIIAKNYPKTNIYINSATLNRQTLNKTELLHRKIMQGGLLEFEMTDQPTSCLGHN